MFAASLNPLGTAAGGVYMAACVTVWLAVVFHEQLRRIGVGAAVMRYPALTSAALRCVARTGFSADAGIRSGRRTRRLSPRDPILLLFQMKRSKNKKSCRPGI